MSVQSIHSDKLEKGSNNQIIIKNTWKKKKRVVKLCEHYLGCRKRAKRVISWEIDRWYGKKIAMGAYCEKHAKEQLEHLKEEGMNPKIIAEQGEAVIFT